MVIHKHHIVPRREGGSDDPSNIIICPVEVHAYLHRIRYATRGDDFDRIASECLSGMIGKDEVLKQVAIESGRRAGKAGKGKVAWNKSIPATQAQKDKQSKAMKGRKLTPEHLENLAKAMALVKNRGVPKGFKHSEATKEKMRLNPSRSRAKPLNDGTTTFTSRRAAADHLGLSKQQVKTRMKKGTLVDGSLDHGDVLT